MRVLVVNAGSHSLQVQLVEDDDLVAGDQVDAAPDGDEARALLEGFIGAHGDVDALGHRIVHGGPRLRASAVVDDAVRAALEEARDLAPLHVPAALAALDAARERLPGAVHVACIDTAFHADLPEPAATYAVPAEWRERHGLRRYGFHGFSYGWALRRCAEMLGRPAVDLHVVLAHLSGGASVCAVSAGRSVWTSMGFTPLEGLVMVTRSGSVDPGMLLWLQTVAGLSADEVAEGLQHRSGLLGLAGMGTGDTRRIVPAAEAGDARAALAMDVYTLRIRQEVAAAAACLPRLDALVLTGEIGVDQPEVREAVCSGLPVLGLAGGLSARTDVDDIISPPGARVPVLAVVPREDLQIASEVERVLGGGVVPA